MWIFWALLSAVLVAARRPIEKKVINELHHFTYGFLVQCVSLPILAAIAICSGKLLNPLSLGIRFWLPLVVISVVFPPLNTFLYTHAIKKGDLSKVLPLQSLLPVFALPIAWLTLGETPSLAASLGVILTVFGIYALGLKGKRLHHPLQPFREDSSSRAMLASMLLITVAGVLEKVAVQASNPQFYSFASSVGAILTLSIAMRLSKQQITRVVLPLAKRISSIGALYSTSYATYLLAIAAGPIAYAAALRSTNILIGSLLGIVLFREKLTKPKVVSFLLIIAGALCLTFGS
ncbi:EamA family transporter [Candidatus Saccharibacteria bacterium]|nr:EamA family transporter [Candidatus Saccharibacteria bacterium]